MLRQSLTAAGAAAFQHHHMSSVAPSKSCAHKSDRDKISPTKKWLADFNDNRAIVPESLLKVKFAGTGSHSRFMIHGGTDCYTMRD